MFLVRIGTDPRTRGWRPLIYKDSLRWRAIGRLKSGQSQVEEARWLQVARKWSPGYGISSKQVVLSAGRSTKVATEHRHLYSIKQNFHANILQPPCRDWPLCLVSSLGIPFDAIQQERLNILEMKKLVMNTTRRGHVLFSDESKCTRQSDSSQVFTWRGNAARFNPSYVKKNATDLVTRNPCVWWNNNGWSYTAVVRILRDADRSFVKSEATWEEQHFPIGGDCMVMDLDIEGSDATFCIRD
ncbi:hypothetical protein TNCV_3437691 [Trichonephila clavipes]|nr:hypothetical protein TNCV_3437691 [Trichonephila clavipes]